MPPHRAFTLLELLISLGLFVVLLGMLWNIISLSTRMQTQGTRLAERSQLVRSLAQLLEDDLRAAIQDPIHPHRSPGAGDDDIRRFGLSGGTRSLRIDVIEINPFAVTQTSESRQAMFGDIQTAEPKAAELKTVFYEFRRETGLARREIDFETADLNAPGPEGSNLDAPEVVDCRFRYFNGSNWSDSWESLDRGGLPVAIEATLRSMPLSEAMKIRKEAAGGDIDTAIRYYNLAEPTTSRIVAYLPTSPVRKFEAYRRKTPPKKEEPANVSPSPAPLPSPTPVEPTEPRQSWIRGAD